jgi:hypothetical protein
LSDIQIQTLKHLHSNGVAIAMIARVLQNAYGLSACVAYYHLSPNRHSYTRKDQQIHKVESQTTKQNIHTLIQLGYTTQDIAQDWNMKLEDVNKLYIG